jgi:hypothetical protein
LVRSGPPRWQRWVLRTLYNFENIDGYDWLGLIRAQLGLAHDTGGPTPMATARHTVQLLGYSDTAHNAAILLAKYGHPAAQTALTAADTDLRSAITHLSHARDALLHAAGANQVTDDD